MASWRMSEDLKWTSNCWTEGKEGKGHDTIEDRASIYLLQSQRQKSHDLVQGYSLLQIFPSAAGWTQLYAGSPLPAKYINVSVTQGFVLALLLSLFYTVSLGDLIQ